MAHLFDALTGNIENQSAIQSILDAQTVTETAPQPEDEDIFQCGKCKKQFTILSMFLAHKQGPCSPVGPPPRPIQPSIPGLQSNSANSAFTAHRPAIQQQPVPASPLTQLTHNMVLMDDQMLTFSDVQSLQNGLLQASSLLPSNTVQATGPFLSQVTQLAPRDTNNITIISPVQSTTSLAPSNGSAFTASTAAAAAAVSNIQPVVQNIQQQITIATVPEKPQPTPLIIKPSPTKAGRKSAQATVISALEEARAKSNGTSTLPEDTTTGGKKKLHCQYCGKAFSKNFDLQQHIRAHTGEKPYQCVVCGRAFAQKSNVKKHMATHKVWPTGSGSSLPQQPPALLIPVQENVEGGQGQDSQTEGQQVVTVSANHPQIVVSAAQPGAQASQEDRSQELPVPVPPVTLPNEPVPAIDVTQTPAANYKLKVVIDNSYLCQYCPEKFKSYFQLKTHMVKHKNEQVYRCVVKGCTSTFKDLDSFLEHTSNHQEDLSFRCHMCGKNYPSLHDLGIHQYTHSLYQQTAVTKSGPRYFQCTKCINKYSTPEALEHHMNTTDHNFPCPHCQKSFTCERFLRRHLASHGTEGLYTCPTCNKNFKTEHYLKSHYLIHTGEKPFECETCGALFNRKDKLKRHNLIHDRKVHYKCPFRTVTGCTKEFNRPDKLKSHIITHSGIKPFRCSTCGKDFARRPHLREHEKGHAGDYPYTCEKCGKGFFRPKLMSQHRCFSEDGSVIPKKAFKPRTSRRKAGRPRKRMITITDSKTNPFLSVPVDSPTIRSRSQRLRGRPRRIVAGKLNKDLETETPVEEENEASPVEKEAEINEDDPDTSKSNSNTSTTDTVSVTEDSSFTVASNPTVVVKGVKENVVEIKIPESEETTASVETMPPKLKKMKQECYVKAPPASLMEQYVTGHIPNMTKSRNKSIPVELVPTTQVDIQIPNGGSAGLMQNISRSAMTPSHIQVTPSTDGISPCLQITRSADGHLQITPSANSAFQPITITQPVTLTVSQQEQLQSLGVGVTTDIIDLPVDIVTVTEEQAIACTEVGDTGSTIEEQVYAEVVRSGAADQQAYINTETGEHIYVSSVMDVEPSYNNNEISEDKEKYTSADDVEEQTYEIVDGTSYENTEESDEQMYVTVDSQIGEFGANDSDEVLQGADLMNAAVEILPSGQVHEISLANVQ